MPTETTVALRVAGETRFHVLYTSSDRVAISVSSLPHAEPGHGRPAPSAFSREFPGGLLFVLALRRVTPHGTLLYVTASPATGAPATRAQAQAAESAPGRFAAVETEARARAAARWTPWTRAHSTPGPRLPGVPPGLGSPR